MSRFWKIFLTNVTILLSCAAFILFTADKAEFGADGGWGILIPMATTVTVQIAINLTLGICFLIAGKTLWGNAFLINSIFMIIIGFSTCVGAVSIRL
jgi:hypothetical protein